MADQPHDARKIFEAAVRLRADDREQFIEEQCAGNADLRTAVERFMQVHVERMLAGGESSTVSAPSDRLIGKLINQEYEILNEIGAGGFGIVYRCRETSLGKLVAVKMFPPEATRSSTIDDLVEEGRKLAVLNHPNVIQVHRAGDFGGRPYIVMEFVEGQTLRDMLIDSSLPLTRALNIMSQTARGLQAIHSHGIVHGDLSARNVMVTRDGTAKILDLGLARFVDTTAPIDRSRRVAGTLMYLAPEVIEDRPKELTSDIFALGVLLYEAVTGRNPFAADTSTAVIRKILTHDPEPLADIVPGSPERLSRLVEHCIAKDPADRLSNLEGVADQIHRCAIESSDESQPPPNAPDPQPKNPYLNRGMLRRHGDFVGRSQEVKRIFARLNASPPGSISIVGDRRIGKSSLLHYVSMPLNRDVFLENPDSMVLVLIDLQQHRGITLEKLLAELITRAQQELGDSLDLSSLPHTLDGVLNLAKQLSNSGRRLALLLDEFEVITTNENFSLEFFSFLRFLANHFDVVYVTSSVRDLQDLCHTKEIADSPFFNIFTTMRLTTLKPAEAEELVVQPARRIGIHLEPYRRFVFQDLAGHFPMFIQIACSHLVEAIQENPEVTPDLEEIQDLYVEEAAPHFRFLWDSREQHELEVIRQIVEAKPVPDSLRDVARGLEAKGYLRVSDGQMRVFSKAFDRFVRSLRPVGESRSFWRRVTGWSRSK